MTLRIGSKSFTLIEVMVTVCVLSFGILLLYQSFFISVDSVQYASNKLAAQIWLESKAWEEKGALMREGAVTQGTQRGEFKFNGRDFIWQKDVQTMDADLFALSLSLSWKEAGRQRSLSYNTYLISHAPQTV